MGNPYRGAATHSAEYFGDSRDDWWNADYLALLARHWQLGAGVALDVGAGVGHWSRLLAHVLPELRFTGIDREPRWVESATEQARLAQLTARLQYRLGLAEALPFEPATFDLVTCQTLLIHVPSPEAVLAEMVRVARPGGLVLVAEPTNIADLMTQSIAISDSPEATAALVCFVLTCQRGKLALGEGNDLLGEALPQLLTAAGLQGVTLRCNDRPAFMLPPYASAAEQRQLEELEDSVRRRIGIWDEATSRRYFLAGGGDESAFEQSFSALIDQRVRVLRALHEQRYVCSAGGLFYLAWGRKPAPITRPGRRE
jgi:SAM-dependent methyltransferase